MIYQTQVAPQAGPMQGGPAPVVLQQQAGTTNTPGYRPGYASKTSAVLGALQLAIGSCCIVFQIAAIVIGAGASIIGTGIWSGVIMIIAGILCLLAARSKTVCIIIAVMVLSIIACLAAFVLLIWAAVGLGFDSSFYYYESHNNSHNGSGPVKAMNSILILLAVMEMIVSIWASAICCAVVCCVNKTPTQGVIFSYGQTVHYPAGGQVIVISGETQYAPGTQVIQTQPQPAQMTSQAYGTPMQPPAYGAYPTQPAPAPSVDASAPPPAYSYADPPAQKM